MHNPQRRFAPSDTPNKGISGCSPARDTNQAVDYPSTTIPAHGIDLTAALHLIGDHTERRAWLFEMLQPSGMAPGSSSRAHARAFRFANALRRAGYQVTEAPLGPRGGRRFTLDSYDGSRAGRIFRLKEQSSCGTGHSAAMCDCFDQLTDEQLTSVQNLHRSLSKTRGLCYDTATLAEIVTHYDAATIKAAVDIYKANNVTRVGRVTLHELLEAFKAALT